MVLKSVVDDVLVIVPTTVTLLDIYELSATYKIYVGLLLLILI